MRRVIASMRRGAFIPGSFNSLLHKLDRSKFVSGPDVASILRKHPGEALPPEFLEYVCLHLEGKVHKPPGRKRIGSDRKLLNISACLDYERYLEWFRKRHNSVGLAGWKPIRDAEWWQGPPHERAARMVTRKWYRHLNWRSVRNLISSQK